MEGVTILSTGTDLFWWQFIWLFINWVYTYYYFRYLFAKWSLIRSNIKGVVLRLFILTALWGGFLPTVILYHEESYEVSVSDDVKMSEFLGKYKIIKQNSQSLTVRIKGE